MRLNRTGLLTLLLGVVFVLTGFPSRPGTAGVQQDNAETYNEQGLALMDAEKFEEAVNVFKQAIKLKPDFADAYYHLGDTYFELSEVKKAVDAYKQAVRYKPEFALAYNQLGTAYRAVGDYKKAVEAYNESIRLDPKALLTHYNLGVVYAEHDKQALAGAEYKILQTLDAGLAQDLYNLIHKPTVSIVSDGSVRLNVMAVDSHGAPISGLTSEDFQVVDDGAAQTVSVALKNNPSSFYGVAIDTSGSMRPAFPLIIAASKYIVEKALPQDQTLLIRFVSSDKIETVQEFTSNKRRLMNGIDQLYIEAGQSAIVDAVYVSAQRLANYKFPDKTVRRVVFLITDGDERASYYDLQQVLALLRSINVQIFAVSISMDDRGGKLNQNQPKRSVDMLRTLASETGGAAFFPKSAAELKTTIDAMFDLVRAEYTIEYKPTKPVKAGSYRPVSVTIAPKPQRENWSVVARPGYVVSAK